MACNKCENGMIREEYENGWTVNKCGCKSPEFWAARVAHKKKMREKILAEYEHKAVI